MNRQELETKLRTNIRQMSCWPKIESGDVATRCKSFCDSIYNSLTADPKFKIDGLSLAVLEADGFNCDHAWLLAYHPGLEEGERFLIIDPTAGQYIVHRTNRTPLNDVFIGTSDEMEATLKARHGDYISKYEGYYNFWSPSARFRIAGDGWPRYSEDDAHIWKKYEFRIHEKELEGDEKLGRWAARMEEAGIDWRRLMIDINLANDGQNKWPDPDRPGQMEQYERIIEARNRHIDLGNDRGGTPFTEMISGSKPGKTRY